MHYQHNNTHHTTTEFSLERGSLRLRFSRTILTQSRTMLALRLAVTLAVIYEIVR